MNAQKKTTDSPEFRMKTMKEAKRKILAMIPQEKKQEAQALLEEIQKGNSGVELEISSDEVLARYEVSEAIELVRCRTAIFLHCNGYWLVSRPTMANNGKGGALYEMLSWYCEWIDRRKDATQTEKDTNDALSTIIVSLLTLPLDVFTDMDFMIGIAHEVITRRAEYYAKLASTPLKKETEHDIVENEAFRKTVLAEEELKKRAKKGRGNA